jgi:hypothetical protein
MIETANPEIDVDALMLRLRNRVAELRTNGHQQPLPVNAIKLRNNVFINSLEAFANIADQKSAPSGPRIWAVRSSGSRESARCSSTVSPSFSRTSGT